MSERGKATNLGLGAKVSRYGTGRFARSSGVRCGCPTQGGEAVNAIEGKAALSADGQQHITRVAGEALCGAETIAYDLHWATRTVIACGDCIRQASGSPCGKEWNTRGHGWHDFTVYRCRRPAGHTGACHQRSGWGRQPGAELAPRVWRHQGKGLSVSPVPPKEEKQP